MHLLKAVGAWRDTAQLTALSWAAGCLEPSCLQGQEAGWPCLWGARWGEGSAEGELSRRLGQVLDIPWNLGRDPLPCVCVCVCEGACGCV